MDIPTLTRFFMWCTIVNVGVLLVAFLMLSFAKNFVYKLHSKWFPMPRDAFNVVIYSFIGLYKVLIFIFNIAPWVALTIIGK